MHLANRVDNDGSGNRAAGRNRRGLFLAATLLTCLSCSSDPSPPDETGGTGGKAQAGSGGSAAAGNRGGAAGDAGTGGSAADSGAAGEEQSGGHSATGGEATGGTSGSGGTAGTGGTAGSSGLAGLGGTAGGGGSAGGSGIGGTAGICGGTAGTGGGTSGTGGTAGAGGTAGTGGAGGAQQGSFTLSSTTLNYAGVCELSAQTLTITNTSGVALTWHATASPATTSVSPNGSTLGPGQAVAVSVLPAIFAPGPASLSINADVAPSQSVQINKFVSGKPPPPQLPLDIDFGNVALGVRVTAFVSVNGLGTDVKIMGKTGPDNNEFQQSGFTPAGQPGGVGWQIYFLPTTLGAKEQKFAFNDFSFAICPPNTFMARGVGVLP